MENLDPTAKYIERIKAFSVTLQNKEDATAVLKLAIQTRCSPEQVEKLTAFCMSKGINLTWVTAEMALIIFAEMELLELNRDFLDRFNKDRQVWIKQYEADHARDREDRLADYLDAKKKVQEHFTSLLATEFELQKKTIDETKALLAQLGSENQLAKDWVEGFMKGAERELLKPVTEAVVNKVNPFIQSIDNALGRIEEVANVVSHKFAVVIQTTLRKSIDDATAANTEQNKQAYEAQLQAINKATNRIQALLQQAEEVKREADWFAFFKTTGSSLALVVIVQIVTLSIFALIVHH